MSFIVRLKRSGHLTADDNHDDDDDDGDGDDGDGDDDNDHPSEGHRPRCDLTEMMHISRDLYVV